MSAGAKRTWHTLIRVALAVVLSALLLLALPPVQLGLVRTIAGASENLIVELDSIWAGPRGIEFENLHIEIARPSLRLDVDSGSVDIGFWSSLLGLGFVVESATFENVAVDVDRGARRPNQEPRARRLLDSGLGTPTRIPPWLSVGRLAANGDVTVRWASGLAIEAPWEVDVLGVSSDADATVDLDATVDISRAGESVFAARVDADIGARIEASNITRLSLDTAIDALNGPAVRLVADADLSAPEERYVYSLTDETGAELADVAIALAPGTALDADWTVNLMPGLVAAIARGRTVADVEGTTSGSLRFDIESSSLAIESTAALQARGFGALHPRLGELGELVVDLAFDTDVEPGLVSANALDVRIGSPEHGDLLGIRALQPLRFERGPWLLDPESWFEREQWLLDPETWAEPELTIRASAFPLPWLGELTPTVDFESGEFNGALELVRYEDGVRELRVTEPLRATDVRLAPVRGVPVGPLDIDIAPRATYDNGALTAEIESLTLSADTGLDVEFQGRASTSKAVWPVANFEGSVSAHVPVLQRMLPQLQQLRGRTSMELDFDSLEMTVVSASVGVDRADGTEMVALELSSREPLHIQLPAFTPDWDGFEPSTLTLNFDEVSMDWINAYVPDLELIGGFVSGSLTAVGAIGRGVTLEATEPLRVVDILPVYRGIEGATPWTASLTPQVHLSRTGSSIVIDDLSIRSQSGNSISASLRIEAPGGDGPVGMDLVFDTDIAEYARRYGLQVGSIHWELDSEIDAAANRYLLSQYLLDVKDASGGNILVIEAVRPFWVATEPFAVAAADGGQGEIFRASVTPLQIENVLPNLFGLSLEGTLPESEFHGYPDPDGSLVFTAEEPLEFRDVSVHWQEATLLEGVTASVAYEASYSAEDVQLRSVEFTAQDETGTTLLHVMTDVVAPLRAERLIDSASIALEANLAPLAAQPVFSDLPRFTAGVLELTYDQVSDTESAVAVDATLRGAVVETVGALPDVDLEADAVGVRGQHVRLDMPLRMRSEENGLSDLRLEGTYLIDSDGVRDLDAALSGERVSIVDLEKLIALVVPTRTEAAEPQADRNEIEGAEADASTDAESGAVRGRGLAPLSDEEISALDKLREDRHDEPVWTDSLLARTSVSVADIAFAGFSVEDVHGELTVTPEAATLQNVRASMFGAELIAAANVAFDAARPDPYDFDFHAEIDDIDLQRMFLAVSPDSMPTAEGRFDLSSTLTGTGRNPIDLGLSTHGELRLDGRDGVFRALAPFAGKGNTAARVIGVLTFSRELRAIGRILDGLGEMPFERAEFLLERSTPDRIDVRNLFVSGPQLRLHATGTLELAPRRPLLLSPIDVSADLAASGDVAILFNGMGLLVEAEDESGYRDLTRTIPVGGTPAEPDTTAFWELLDEAAENTRGFFGASLRALDRRLNRRLEASDD